VKKHFLYIIRYALWCILMSSYCVIRIDAQEATESSAESAEQIAAVKDEVEKNIKEGKGSMSFDQLFAIWDKTTNAASKAWDKTRSTVSKGTSKGASLLDLIPKPFLNAIIQKELGIKNVSITSGPIGYKNSFYITGTATAAGKPVFVTLLYAPIVPDKKRGGNSLSFGIPAGTPLDQIIPGANVSALGTVPISDMRLVISDFEYTDPNNSYPIISGLNIFVGLDPKGLSVLNLDKVKSIVQYEGAPILGVATVERVSAEDENNPKKKTIKPTFKVIIPPGALKITEIKLSQLLDTLNVSVPANIKDEVSKASMKNIEIGLDLTPGYQSFSISGDVFAFGDNALAKYKVFRANASSENQQPQAGAEAKKQTVTVNRLSLIMSPHWNAAQLFPQLKTFGNQPLLNASLNIVSGAYHDGELDSDVSVGFDLQVSLDPKSLDLLNTEKVKKIVQLEGGSIIGMMSMRATTKEEAAQGAGSFKTSFSVVIPPGALKIKQVKLSDLLDVANLSMPANVKSECAKVMINNIDVGLDLTPGSQKFMLDGDVVFFGNHALATYQIFMADSPTKGKAEGAQASKILVNKLSMKMPTNWNISSTFPQLRSLANISINRASLDLISQGYHDTVEDIDIMQGLQLDGFINLSTMSNNPVIKAVGNALGGQIELHGNIPPDIASAQFEVTLSKNKLAKLSLSLGDLIPSSLSAMKQELSKASYSLEEFRMKFGGRNAQQSVNILGTASIGSAKMPTEVQMMFVKNPNAKSDEESILTGSWKANLILTIPNSAEKAIHGLDVISTLPFSSFKMAMIEAPYVDPDSGIDFKEGFNIGGYLGFSGSLSFVKKLFPIKGLEGLNINGVVEKLDPTMLIRNIKLEASIPGAGSLKIGSVTMSSPKLYISLGTMMAFGIEGSMKIPVPKEFRPKGNVSRSPARTAYIPVTIGDIATSMDADRAEITDEAEAEVNQAPISAESTVTDQDIFITEEALPAEEQQAAHVMEQEAASPDDLSPLPELVDVVEDLSVYDAPVGDNQSLTLTSSLAIAGEAGVMSCEMDGVVDILGLILKNVAFEGQVVIAAPPIPTGLGFRADMQIGTGPKAKMINFAAKMAVGSTTTSYAWFGSFKGGLYLSDIVNLSYNVAKRAPQSTQKVRDEFFSAMNKIPKLGIDELQIAIVPIPTMIAGKLYEEGTLFDMKFVLFGAHGLAKAKMGLTGMELDGALDKITIPSKSPQFILSNFDGTKGPSVHLILGTPAGGVSSLVKNQFSIDGNIEIKPFGMKSATQVLMTPTGGEFKMVEKMYGLYETELQGTLPGTHITKSRFKGTFKQDGLSKLSKMLRDASNDFINESNRELNRVRDDLRKTYDDKIATQRNIVRNERERATSDISKANQKAQTDIKKEEDKTRAEIARLKKKISDKENECKRAKWYRKADVCIKTGGEITGYGTQLAAQETYLKGLLRPGKAVASGTLNAAKDVVNVTPIDSDPRVASLIAAKETALAGIKIGNMSAQGLGELGKALATLGDQAVNLKSVTLDVSLPDIMNLKLPKFSIEGVFFGKKLHLKDFELDLKNPATLKLLSGKILNLIKKIS
jgi:hypothetical protein